MRKITVFIDKGEKTVYLRRALVIDNANNVMTLKKATVYWAYSNVVKDVNDKVVIDTTPVTAESGYQTFDMMKSFLLSWFNSLGVSGSVRKNEYDGLCRIQSNKRIQLKSLGTLLGYEEDTVIPADNTTVVSPKRIEMNRNLRYVEVHCDIVDTDSSINNGNRSTLVSALPVTSEQTLMGSIQRFTDVESRVYLRTGVYTKLTFRVSGNNGANVGSVLLDLYIG